MFDAAGLALFCSFRRGQGTGLSLRSGGGNTAWRVDRNRGGMVRDILVVEIPTVLRTELYAVAALIGAAVMVVGEHAAVPGFRGGSWRRISLFWTPIHRHATRVGASHGALARTIGMERPNKMNAEIFGVGAH